MMTRAPLARPGLLLGVPQTPSPRRLRVSAGGRKHKMEGEPEGAPLPKKRPAEEDLWRHSRGVSEAGGACSVVAPAWKNPRKEEEEEEEEMETPAGEEEVVAARRRLREIEERIIDEEEEEEEEEVGDSGGPLPPPTLVLSDALKSGLRRDYQGGLTRKIIESMSRPSMELVLWKPLLPAFLSGRPDETPHKPSPAQRGTPKPESLRDAFEPGAPAPSPPHPPPPPLLFSGKAGGPLVEEEEEEMEL